MQIFMKLFFINLIVVVNISNKFIEKAKLEDSLCHKNKIKKNQRNLEDSSYSTIISTTPTTEKISTLLTISLTTDLSSTILSTKFSTESTSTILTSIPTTELNIILLTTTPITELFSTLLTTTTIESTSTIPTEINTTILYAINTTELTTIPTTEDIISTIISEIEATNSTELLPRILLLGYDNYDYSSNILSFFTYVRFFETNPLNTFIIIIQVYGNLRVLQEKVENTTVTCKLISSTSNDIYNYYGTSAVVGSITKVEIVQVPFTDKTSLAENMEKNLQNQKGNILSDKGFIVLDECSISTSINKNPIIICSVDSYTNSSLDNSELKLHIINNNDKTLEVPAIIKKNDNGSVQIEIEPIYSLNSNLNKTLGTITNGENIYLVFNEGEDSNLVYTPYNGVHISKRNTRGLSAGGIVAIILPCLAVLIAIGAVVFFLGKKNITSPLGNIGNNTIGINSSTNALN